jgi:hypothetical protein
LTRFTVPWDPEVEDIYITVWLAGDSETRRALTDIANWVDRGLAEDPDVQGQALPELTGRTIEIPIAESDANVRATYTVSRDDRVVRVIRLSFGRG